MKKSVAITNKFGFKIKNIEMGIFDYTVCAIIGNYKNIKAFINWKFEEDWFNKKYNNDYSPRGQVLHKNGYVPILWIPKLPKTAREHATLAHEALHCVYHLFDWANIPMSRDTEEIVTHSMSHIITEILKVNK